MRELLSNDNCLKFQFIAKTAASRRWMHEAKRVTELEKPLADAQHKLADAEGCVKELDTKV